MSYKTDRLTDLFPSTYAATDSESLLYKLLDAMGAELMVADDAVKRLLKSHWVDYASGAGLDGLGATFGVGRRVLRDGTTENDDAFRRRLRSVVPLFTGGGTVSAVRGAVRSALGLPFDLNQLNLPDRFAGLRDDLDALVVVEEFSPTVERVLEDAVVETGGASRLTLVIDIPSIQEDRPRIAWTFTSGGGRLLSLEVAGTGVGVKAEPELIVPEGKSLLLSAEANGRLSASIDLDDITPYFTNLDGTVPATLPDVPAGRSEWIFQARSGVFDTSAFDGGESFDLPRFGVELSWVRRQPLTFDVYVPYFLQEVVTQLQERHGYTGELFVFQGLPLDQIQEVVDQTRATGVRGSVHFSLDFFETHDQSERLTTQGRHQRVEDAAARESLAVGSVDSRVETHGVGEIFALGGVFDVATLDTNFAFQ
jgi:hypothetical protein